MNANERRREPRRIVERQAIIGRAGKVYPAAIINVSTAGMNIKTGYPLQIGQKLDIFCGELSSKGATVAWIENGTAGLNLEKELPLQALDAAISLDRPISTTIVSVGLRIARACKTKLGAA